MESLADLAIALRRERQQAVFFRAWQAYVEARRRHRDISVQGLQIQRLCVRYNYNTSWSAEGFAERERWSRTAQSADFYRELAALTRQHCIYIELTGETFSLERRSD